MQNIFTFSLQPQEQDVCLCHCAEQSDELRKLQRPFQHAGLPAGFLARQRQDVQRASGRGEGRPEGAAQTAGAGAGSDQAPAGGGKVPNPGEQNHAG